MTKLPTNDEEFMMEVRDASPTHLLMKIKSFSLLSKPCESAEFEAGDCKWRLIIHPNGPINSRNDEDDHISVYLTIVETNSLPTNVENSSLPVGWEVTAAFSIFLYNQVLDNYLCFQGKMRRFHALKSQWGFSKLISKGSLRAPGSGFLVDDICVFGAEVAVVKTQRVAPCMSVHELGNTYKRDWKISSFSKLGTVWKSEEFTVGQHKWYIQLYPNRNMGEGQSVSMYLYLADAESFASHEKVKADFHLRIKNQLNDQHRSLHASSYWLTSSCKGGGLHAFIPLSDMRDSKKGFVVKDCCIVEVEISVKAVES